MNQGSDFGSSSDRYTFLLLDAQSAAEICAERATRAEKQGNKERGETAINFFVLSSAIEWRCL